MWKAKKVLITGICGFIGSNLAEELSKRGAEIYGIELPGKASKHRLIECDLADGDQASQKISEIKPDIIFHAGGQAIAWIAKENPVGSFEANVITTLNLLESSRKMRIPLIYSSTRDIYDRTKPSPFTEQSNLSPTTIYDSTKLAADNLTSAYYNSYGTPVAIVRASNVYGPNDLNFGRIIPKAIQAIILDKPLDIYGDGSSSRDYVYVSDLVEGYILVAENLMLGKCYGEAFNLSGDGPVSVKEIIEKLKDISGKNIDVRFNPRQKIVRDINYASSDKAKMLLHWKPKLGIDAGLKLTFEWYKENMQL